MENHGATDSSNQWVRSDPGWCTVGGFGGSSGSRSVQVTSFPDPERFDMNRTMGSSWPM
jgi:hypothetical protein